MHPMWPSERELALLTDLYELTMTQAYWRDNHNGEAVFSLFFRELPPARRFVVACGQEYAAHLIRDLRFYPEQVDRLRHLDLFSDDFLDWLTEFRFEGEVRALPEGSVVFPNQPLLEVRAPLIQGQLLESLLMNYVNLETLLASKAVRMVIAAEGKPVMDFGMRRMHGLEAAWRGVRAYRVAGIAGTSNVLGGQTFGLPLRGTMAHSYIQSYEDETEALRRYARDYPGTTLLIDTYDTLRAVDQVIALVRDEGLSVGAVRIDSGDLGELARQARQKLDQAGLHELRIVVSGGLNEDRIQTLVQDGAPIDGFGVGTEMGSVADAPSLDFAYKLTEYQGSPRLKTSPGKRLYPGAKQVWRFSDGQGRCRHDEITARDEARDGMPLLRPVIVNGEPVAPLPDPDQARQRLQDQLDALPAEVRSLAPMDDRHGVYPVHISATLKALREGAVPSVD